MTYFLLLITAVVAVEIVSGVRTLRSGRPVSPPASHPDWTGGRLPSVPYALRH
jgi:hypothetical protein